MQDIKGCANRIVPFLDQNAVAMEGGGEGGGFAFSKLE